MAEFYKTNPGFKAEFLALIVLFSIALISLLGIFSEITKKYSVEFPAIGGTLREGIVGSPRFINPLLAQTNADNDLVALVFSGLYKYGGEGKLVPALADHYNVSSDGLVYTVTLKNGLFWQDGEPLTADDVIFTIQSAKNPQLLSPKRANWEGIEVSKINDKNIQFTLKKPYVPFLENLTLGILPQHLWKQIPANQFSLAELNTNPVGAGPYKLNSIRRDSLGTITSASLGANKNFVLGEPHISSIQLSFYKDEAVAVNNLKNNSIDSFGALSPKYIKDLKNKNSGLVINSLELKRIIAIFLNQSTKKDLASQNVRKALNVSIDRKSLIDNILGGFGDIAAGPLPESAAGDTVQPPAYDQDFAKTLLSKKKNGLSITLTTANTPELVATANMIKNMWQTIGVNVGIKIFDVADLESLVIGPRRYDAFLYGEEVIGENPDPFAFWHSSQRAYPGYNIALYANSKVDKLLETVRQEKDPAKRESKYAQIQKEISNDIPAIFLFSPSYVYALPDYIKGVNIKKINTGSDRFATINEWYINSQYVWKIFAK